MQPTASRRQRHAVRRAASGMVSTVRFDMKSSIVDIRSSFPGSAGGGELKIENG
jgi:hypothetical protein